MFIPVCDVIIQRWFIEIWCISLMWEWLMHITYCVASKSHESLVSRMCRL